MYRLSRMTQSEKIQFLITEIGISIMNNILMDIQLVYMKQRTSESHNVCA